MRIYMQLPAKDNQPPRFYQLRLEPDLFNGWHFIKEWGLQGASGRLSREHFANQDDAEEALTKTRDSQLKRGYQIVFAQGHNNR